MIDWVSIISIVAMAPGEGGEQGPGGLLGNPLVLVVMIIVLFYFILYKPEKRKKEEREKMLKSLGRGDEVITAGGIYGKITALTDNVVTVEVAPGTRVRVSRQHVSSVTSKESRDSEEGKGKSGKKDK